MLWYRYEMCVSLSSSLLSGLSWLIGTESRAAVVQRLAWTEQLSNSRSEAGLDWSSWAAVVFQRLAWTGAVEQQSFFRDWLGLEQLSSSRPSEIGLDWSSWETVVVQRLAWTGAIEAAVGVQRLAWTGAIEAAVVVQRLVRTGAVEIEARAEEGEGKAWHFFEQRQDFRKLECSGRLMESREECENTDFSTRFLAYLCDSSAVAYDAHQLCWSRISAFCLARVSFVRLPYY